MRIKISDGDYILVCLNGKGVNAGVLDRVEKHLKSWVTERGLQGIKLQLVASPEGVPGATETMSITVLSVNDIFQEHVLNGATKTEG
jgi:hypothetical protein